MLLPPRFWATALAFPRAFRGTAFHRAGLAAAAARDFALADRLYEAAALRYREDLRVPELARLRVHQIMARAEACFDADHDAALEYALEVERRLHGLDRIEDVAPPFDAIRAEALLTSWSARFRIRDLQAA